MPPLGPGHIVDEVVHRDVGKNRGRVVGADSLSVVEAAKSVIRLTIQTGFTDTLPDKRVSEVVDQVVANNVGVADGDSFAVVGLEDVRGQTRKLRRQRLMIVLQIAAQEQRMVSVRADFVVKLEDESVKLCGIVPRKGEP